MTTNELPKISFDLSTLENSGSAGPATVTKFQRERIKGLQHYKILPPFGAKANGSLFHFYKIHWGLTGEHGGEKPVACSYPTEGHCPICKKVWDAKDELERAQKNGNKEEEEKLLDFIKKFDSRRFYAYNALTYDDRVVILELTKTAHDQLVKLISECVVKKGFDPTSLETGVWFSFNRTGAGFKTKYTVDYKKIEVNVDGEILEKLDRKVPMESVAQSITKQLANPEEGGPLYDIHDLHQNRTAKELQSYLDGGVVMDRKPVVEKKSEAVLEDDVPDKVGETTTASAGVDVKAEIERLKQLKQKSREA